MAKDEELGIRLRVRGLQETRRKVGTLQKLFNNLRGRAEGALGLTRDKDGKLGVGENGLFGRNAGGGSGGGGAAGVLRTTLGNLFASSLQAFSQNVKQAFDPNLTKTERQVSLGSSVLEAIPGIGGVASGILSNLAQTQLGVAQGTQNKLNQIFGPAFEAFGAANANLSDAELEKAIEKRFGPAVARVQGLIKSQERGRELGSQFLAGTDEGIDIDALKDKAKKQASEQLGIDPAKFEGFVNDLQNAADNFKTNTESFGKAVEQIVEFWGQKLGIGGQTQ